MVSCFAWSVKAQSLAPKKVYITDPGIIKTSAIGFGGNRGAGLENFVYNSLRLELSNCSSAKSGDLYYFSGKNGGECDFIITPHERPRCIQVCWELTPDNRERKIHGLLEAMEFFDQETGTVITHNTEDVILSAGKKINVIPAWKTEAFGAVYV